MNIGWVVVNSRKSLAFWSILVCLGLPACATVWEPFGEPGQPTTPVATPENEQSVEDEESAPEVVVAGTLQERYPLIRFIEHADDLFTGLITVPKGKGESISEVLRRFCTCLAPKDAKPEELDGAATLRVESEIGLIPVADLSKQPWDQASDISWKEIEDTLVLTGSEAQVDEVLSFLNVLYNAGPQIEIQARIVEVTGTDLFERGVIPSGSAPIFRHKGGTTNRGTGPFFRGIGGAFPTSTGQNFAGTAGSGGVFDLGLLQNDLQVQAFIQILSTIEQVDIVARPRVVVRNGVKADLSSAEQIPAFDSQSVGSQGVTNQKITYKDVGVDLKVIPFLIGEDTIHMMIQAEVSRLGRNVILTTDSQGNPIFSPTINTRTATTDVFVRDGQSVYIGGLILNEDREIVSKVPILGDVPGLDLLFSSKEVETIRTEVFFLITPKVKVDAPSISPFGEIGDLFDPFEQN